MAYIEGLLAKCGSQFPRRTRITDLEQVDARDVALRNIKVGHDRANHFVGSEIRNSSKTEPPLLCSEYDRLVLLRNDGVFQVIPIPAKVYVGPVKYLLRAERDQVYSILYRDRRTNAYSAKRFRIDRYIMEKEYASLPKNSIIEALYTNQGVVLDLVLKPNSRRQVDSIQVAFAEIEMRSATARGFKVSGYPVDAVVLVDRGTAPVDEPTPPATADAEGTPTELPATTEAIGADLATPAAAGLPAAPSAADDARNSALSSTPEPVVEIPATDPTPDRETATPPAAHDPMSRPPKGTARPARAAATPDQAAPARDVGRDWQRRTQAATKGLEPARPLPPAPATAEPLPPTPTESRQAAAKSKRPAGGPEAPETATPKPAESSGPQPKTRRPPPAPPAKLPAPDPAHRLIDEETPFFLE